MATHDTATELQSNDVNSGAGGANDKRWLILMVVAGAQLMVVLDLTIVNIALPKAQAALGFPTSDRQWIITAYALAFGSLLLLTGRLSDLFGRKSAFLVGMSGFAVASAIGGASPDFAVLAGARAAQGAFGSLLAPAALSTLTNTFRDPAERGKAFAVFGAVAGGGSAVGLLLGGLLTEYLSWRYCLYVNLIFAAILLPAAALLLSNERPDNRPRLDIAGTVLTAAGLFALVFGFSRASTDGWGSTETIVSLIIGVVLLVSFVIVEQRVNDPLLPMRIVLNRTRGGAYLAVGLASMAVFAVFLFVTYYLQGTLDYSPVKNGLAFLPLTAGILIASTLSNVVLLPRLGARPLVAAGMTLGTIGMLGFLRLTAGSGYVSDIMPSLIVLGIGFGLLFAPAINVATAGVDPSDAGIASAMVNVGQQVGGSIGTSLLSTIAVSATTSYAVSHSSMSALATVHGYHVAFIVAAGIFAFGAITCGSLLQSKKTLDSLDTAAA